MNDKGLSMGESTCSSKTKSNACTYEGQREEKKNCALLSINELGRIGMERESTARAAIQLMGGLAEQYGFYGPAENGEGTGESLLIADTTEAWIFHIVASDSNGLSAVWVAQRIPEEHVAVVANAFVIRVIDFSDADNFL